MVSNIAEEWLIQVTGKQNYKLCGDALGIDLVNHPELLEQPKYAVSSAVWYWITNNINAHADEDDIKAITKAVNGGYNGLAEREKYYITAKQQLFC